MKHIYDYLLYLGVKPSMKGFDYIVELVELANKHGFNTMGIFTMYGELAKKHGVTAWSIERAVRHAICSAMNRNTGVWYDEFAELVNDDALVTNKDLISGILLKMRQGKVRLNDVKEEDNNG